MEQPIMVYYQLNNFYQNHRRYVKSKSDDQLNGKYLTLTQIKNSDDCSPVETNEQMDKTKSYDGTTLDPKAVATPCGLIAKSFFNDTYEIRGPDNNDKVNIDESDIAWEADKKLKYKNVINPDNANDANFWQKVQWIDMKDEHFIVWMRPSLLPNFRKLYVRIHQDLEKGTYQVTVSKPLNVKEFNGEKYFVLSTVNVFGGKNWFLSIAYIAFGGLCLLLALLFVILYNCKGSPFKEKSQ